MALPNVEYPDEPFTRAGDRPRPAGFGAVACHWDPRAALAGTYDDRWLRERQPLVPDDFDDRFFQCAPEDQQPRGFLQGGEPVHLYRVTTSEHVRFSLPRIALDFETRFFDGTRQLHESCALHTVIVEPDYPRLSLVWHSSLRCHFKVHKLERTVVTLATTGVTGESGGHES